MGASRVQRQKIWLWKLCCQIVFILMCEGLYAGVEIDVKKKLFSDSKESVCLLLKAKNLKEGYPNYKTINPVILDVLKSIKNLDRKGLLQHFHPRIKKGQDISKVFNAFHRTLNSPYETSIYKLWVIFNKKKSTKELLCEDKELSVFPHPGYDVQFAAMIQVLGKRNLGRVFITFVPNQSSWVIGSFDFKQWTHAGKNYQGWLKQYFELKEKKQFVKSFFSLDLAHKLLLPGRYYQYMVKNKVDKKLLDNKSKWQKKVEKQLSFLQVKSFSTTLFKGGYGLSVRINQKLSTKDKNLPGLCKRLYEKTILIKGLSDIKGLACLFHPLGHDLKGDARARKAIYNSLN